MNEPKWLRSQAALIAHRRQLAQHGGIAGVRDFGLLESAISRPRNLYAYSRPKPDLAALATAYAYGLVRNHPFLDGNKRTGWTMCRIFLRINGFEVNATQDEKAATVMQLAASEITEEEFAAWLRSRLATRKD